jgi:hypothetical protein
MARPPSANYGWTRGLTSSEAWGGERGQGLALERFGISSAMLPGGESLLTAA